MAAYAIRVPSADQAANPSCPGRLDTSTTPVPAAFIVWISSPLPPRSEENAILPFAPGNAARAVGVAENAASTSPPTTAALMTLDRRCGGRFDMAFLPTGRPRGPLLGSGPLRIRYGGGSASPSRLASRGHLVA